MSTEAKQVIEKKQLAFKRPVEHVWSFNRLHDPLCLIQDQAPSNIGRIILWSVCLLFSLILIWSIVGKLDIVASAEGKLVPRTLIKVVQPAEAGIVKELLVSEGDEVTAGQLLAKLDTTLASADRSEIESDLEMQRIQQRRVESELSGVPMQILPSDNPRFFAIVEAQFMAHQRAFRDNVASEQGALAKQIKERQAAEEVLHKLEQTLPTYKKVADAYGKLEHEGFMGSLAATDKAREAMEKAHDLDAQRKTVSAMASSVISQESKIRQLDSAYRSELQRERSDIQAKIAQLIPSLEKVKYRAGLMELRAPQGGVIKDLATTTVGAVVQPGAVVMTIVPNNEFLYADVNVKNEDIGFTHVGQKAQIKISAYPFQQYGMLTGEVIRLSLDSGDNVNNSRTTNQVDIGVQNGVSNQSGGLTYKARIRLDQQSLKLRTSNLSLTAGMQVNAEIHEGSQSLFEYLLSPLRRTFSEAARER